MPDMEIPYLSLSVSQAAKLSQPLAPEPSDHSTFTLLLQHRAKHQPSQIAAGFPQRRGKECLTYTYGQLSLQAVNLAGRLKSIISTQCRKNAQPVIALYGPSGPQFLLHIVACWYLGAGVLPIALGTSPKGAASLLSNCESNAVLYCNSKSDDVKEIKKSLDGDCKPVMVEWLTNQGDINETPLLIPLYEATSNDKIVIFHSSGSTGIPKPLIQLHKFWSRSLTTAAGTSSAAFTTTPLFHGGLSDLFRSIQASAPIYFYPWHLQLAPTVDNILDSIQTCNQEICYFLSVPFILEMLIKDEKGSLLLIGMDMVSTGGAPLSEAIGDQAVREMNIKLVSRMGSSECGFLMSSYRKFESDEDWSWLRLSDQIGKSWLKFEAIEEQEPNIYELVVSSEWPTKFLSNRSDGSFATSDLYERHSQRLDLWRYKRRADDAIVMVNGKKIPASLVESSLCALSIVKDAIVFGSNRALLGSIVFPSTPTDPTIFRIELKAHLSLINHSLPSHGRIPIEMCHVGDAPLYDSLPRSSKGTLQRGLALEKMADLIDTLYRQFEEGQAPRTETRKSIYGKELTLWLKTLVEEILGVEIGVDDDFYRVGIDSIMAARIKAGVHQGLDMNNFRLKSNDVYTYPTIALLSRYIDGKGACGNEKPSHVMSGLVKKHSTFSIVKAKDDAYCSNGPTTVILTGATGSLGCRILYELIVGEFKVDNVICLVRAKNSIAARDRIKAALYDKGLSIDEKKIDCVTNLWEVGMKKNVTGASSLSIIHCAWIVNFALQVESFEKDCISDLKDLLDFFRSCSNATRFIFCSSLASILQGKSPHREEESTDTSDSGFTGYGNSKWVAEKICERAGDNVVIVRIGQLCGDNQKGIWNTSEAWPLMIKSAQEVGSLPESGPDIDWLPIDVAAKGIVEITRCSTIQSRYHHVALPPNVTRPSWQSFLHWLKKGGLGFEIQSKNDWLQSIIEKKDQVRGSALIDIWAGIPTYGSKDDDNVVETKHAIASSKSLANANAIDEELCTKMIQAWKLSGFLE